MLATRLAAFCIVTLSLLPVSVRAQDVQDSTKLTAARELLKASHAADAMVAGMRASLQRQAMPQVPAEFWTLFEQRMIKDVGVLADSIASVYATKFSLDELQQLTAFYNSPIGRRAVELQPEIISESSAVGQRWGRSIGEQIAKELTKD